MKFIDKISKQQNKPLISLITQELSELRQLFRGRHQQLKQNSELYYDQLKHILPIICSNIEPPVKIYTRNLLTIKIINKMNH